MDSFPTHNLGDPIYIVFELQIMPNLNFCMSQGRAIVPARVRFYGHRREQTVLRPVSQRRIPADPSI